MVEYKSYALPLFILIVSIVSIFIQNKKESISINDTKLQLNLDNMIAVYIAGEVVNPGVYYIEENSRLVDLIEKCGGFTNDADLEDLNLAEVLEDTQKIEVPKIVIKEYISIEDDASDNNKSNTDSNLVNINTASIEELKSLNGIGDTLAKNIVEYRKNNKFESIEDLLNVSGIGEAKYEKVKEYICIN